LTLGENLSGLTAINRELIARAEAMNSPQRVVLDMDSTDIPVYGRQESSSYNGNFESTCYHPLLLFTGVGDCVATKLRPGNVHGAEERAGLLLPEIDRQQSLGKEVVFRADAAFAKPAILRAAGGTGSEAAIRIPANDSLERGIQPGPLQCRLHARAAQPNAVLLHQLLAEMPHIAVEVPVAI
jgi:hypothetical protein